MNSLISRAPFALSISAAVLLTACGGGGGGTPVSTSQTASSITLGNSKAVAAEATSASSALTGGSSAAADLATGVSVSTTKTGLVDATLQQMFKALKIQPANLVVGITATESINCTNGGTATVTANYAESGNVSNGDVLSFSSNECIEGGTRLNGSFSIAFSNLTGNPRSTPAWGATLGITFANFTVAEGTESDTVNGDLTLAYNQSDANTANFTGSGNSLQLRTVEGSSSTEKTLAAYSLSGSKNASNLHTYRTNFTLSGNFPTLGNNSFTVRTLTDFEQQQGESNPSKGVLTVTAANNSSLRLTALNSTNVQLDVDTNGDNVVDQTTTSTWAELDSLI